MTYPLLDQDEFNRQAAALTAPGAPGPGQSPRMPDSQLAPGDTPIEEDLARVNRVDPERPGRPAASAQGSVDDAIARGIKSGGSSPQAQDPLDAAIRAGISRVPPSGPQALPEEGAFAAGARGFKDSFKEAKSTFQGAAALAADAAGFHETAKGLFESAQKTNQEEAGQARPSDEFTNVWNDPTPHNIINWASHTVGNLGGNIAQMMAVEAAAGAIGTAVAPGPGTVAGLAAGSVGKDLAERYVARKIAEHAARIATENEAAAATGAAARLTAEQIETAAGRSAVQDVVNLGRQAAGVGYFGVEGAGGAYNERQEDLGPDGQQTGADLAREATLGLASGFVQHLAQATGIRTAKGDISAFAETPGIGGRVARGAVGAGLVGGEMAGMTALQDLGAGRDLSLQNEINSAASGALFGSAAGLHRARAAEANKRVDDILDPSKGDPVATALAAADESSRNHALFTGDLARITKAVDQLTSPGDQTPLLGYTPAERHLPGVDEDATAKLEAASRAAPATDPETAALQDAARAGQAQRLHQGAVDELAEDYLKRTYAQNIADRGGVAAPHEAEFFSRYGQKPYDSIAPEGQLAPAAGARPAGGATADLTGRLQEKAAQGDPRARQALADVRAGRMTPEEGARAAGVMEEGQNVGPQTPELQGAKAAAPDAAGQLEAAKAAGEGARAAEGPGSMIALSRPRQTGEEYTGPDSYGGKVKAIAISDLPKDTPAGAAKGLSQQKAQALQQILRTTGRKLQVFDGNSAFHDPSDPNTIHIGNQISEPLVATLFHEIKHSIETHFPALAGAFDSAVAAHMTPEQGERFKAEYGGFGRGEAHGPGAADASHVREMGADTLGAIAQTKGFMRDFYAEVARQGGANQPRVFAKVVALIDRLIRHFQRGADALKPGDRFHVASELAKIEEVRSEGIKLLAADYRRRQVPARLAEAERLQAAHEVSRLPLTVRRVQEQAQAARLERSGTSFEVAPHPRDAAAWDALPAEKRQQISDKVVQTVVAKTLRQFMLPGRIERQVGGYEGKQNPSYVLRLTNPGRAVEAAKILGRVLGQKSMAVVTAEPHEGSFPMGELRIGLPKNMGYGEVEKLYARLQSLNSEGQHDVISGHSTQGSEMRILHGEEGDGTREKVQSLLGSNYDVQDNTVHASFPEEGKDYGKQGDGSGLRQGERAADLLRDEAAGMVSRETAAAGGGGQARAAEGGAERQERGARADSERGAPGRQDAEGLSREDANAANERNPAREVQGEPVTHESRAADAEADRPAAAREAGVSVIGTHFSPEQRQQLRSDYYGRGLLGAERNRVMTAEDDRLRHRIHFYVNTGNGIRAEPGTGAHIHEARLNNLWDSTKHDLPPVDMTPPKGSAPGRVLTRDERANRIETAILNAGYDGYLAPFGNGKAAVMLGKRSIPADYIGTGGSRPPRKDELGVSESRAGAVNDARTALGKNGRLLDDVDAYRPSNPTEDGRTRLNKDTGRMTVLVRPELLDESSEAGHHVLLHESGHVADLMGTVYSRHPDLAKVTEDLHYLRTLDGAARKVLDYPLSTAFRELWKDPERTAAEVFAQGWAMFHTPYFRDLMKEETPYAHQFFQDAAAHAAAHAGDTRLSARESAERRASFDGDRSLSREQSAGGAAAGQVREASESRAKRGPDKLDPEDFARYSKLVKRLTPDEQDELTHATAKNLIDQIDKWPSSAKQIAAAAYAGRAKRGWYADTVKAIGQVFGLDAPRFSALLAATSPQTDVNRNFGIATRLWANWVRAGRPQDRATIERLGGEAAKGAGAGWLHGAYSSNAVIALTHPDPVGHALSGPKVDSFMRNLLGHVNEVTNDTWMANFHGVSNTLFGGKGIAEGERTRGAKNFGYLAASIRTREAADILSKRTGVPWSPAEVQETVWAWAKTLAELGDKAGNTNRSLTDLLNDPEFSHELVKATPDFRSLFHNDALDGVLRKAGYGDQLDALGSGGHNEHAEAAARGDAAGETAPFDRGTQERLDRQNAERLQQTRTPDRVIAESRATAQTPEFKRWFGDSVTRDEEGEPKVLYHGTSKDKDFKSFNVNQRGAWFTDNPTHASEYADQNDSKGHRWEGGRPVEKNTADRVIPAYVRIEKPYTMTDEDHKFLNSADNYARLQRELFSRVAAKGHDGIDFGGGTWVALKGPDQIKSVFNNGEFQHLKNMSESRPGQIRQEWDDHKDITPEQRATLEKVGAIVPKQDIKTWWAKKTANWKERAVAGVLDDLAPLMKLDPTRKVSTAYMLGKLSRGYQGTMEAMLRYGKARLENGAPNVDVNDPQGGYAAALSKLYVGNQSEVQRALWWIAGQRAENLKKVGLENLMEGQDIANLKALNQGKMADGRDRATVYAQFLKDHTEFNNSVLDVAEQSGLITPDVAKMFRDHPYVPFYRVVEDANNGMLGPISRSGLTDQKAWKRIKGGDQPIFSDLLENSMANWAHLFQASAKNRAALETVDTLIKHHIDLIEPVLPGMDVPRGAVALMRDGQREQYIIHDPLVTQAIGGITNVTPEYLKSFGYAKRLLTQGITVSPFFRIRIATREALASLIQSEIGKNPLTNVAEGWGHTNVKSQIFASTLASGGQIRFGNSERSLDALSQVKKLVNAPPDPGLVPWLSSHISNVWDAYHEVGNRTENFNRTALYNQLRQKTNPDTGQNYTHAEASFAARDLLDFSAGGGWGAIKFLEQTVPFFNARKQGLYSIGKTAANDPHGLLSLQNRVTAITTTAGLASLALMLGQQDEDWWQNRTDYDRDAYWAFKLGGTIFRIPKPFELGAAATQFERTWELATRKDMTLAKYGDNVRQTILNSLALDPTPQLVKPWAAVFANKDPVTNRAIDTPQDLKSLPSDRYDEDTSGVARALGSMGIIPNLADLAQARVSTLDPKQVDYMIKSYLGAAGVGAAGVLDYLGSSLQSTERPAMTLKQMTGSLVSDEASETASRFTQEMHDHLERIREASNSVKEAMARGDVTRAAELRDEYSAELRGAPRANATEHQIEVINRQIRQTESSALLGADEKRRMLTTLQQRKSALARSFEEATAASN